MMQEGIEGLFTRVSSCAIQELPPEEEKVLAAEVGHLNPSGSSAKILSHLGAAPNGNANSLSM
jgi:hypothetical protein